MTYANEKLRHHFIPSHYARWRDKPQFDTKFRHIDTAMAEKINTQKVDFTLGIIISCKYLSEVSHKNNKITEFINFYLIKTIMHSVV
jgi:hypothetical protein